MTTYKTLGPTCPRLDCRNPRSCVHPIPKPPLPEISAPSMLVAQGWIPTATERAALDAHGDYFRSKYDGFTEKVNVRITVRDMFTGEKIGWIGYQV